MSEHEKVKRPASQYYWGDWFRDLALQSCSQPARGLWHEMNCLMHQGEPYGHLTMPNGKPMGPEQLANLCKISAAACRKMLTELEDNGVFSKAESGAIYSRRMVRDEAVREARANGGKEGAEHGHKGAEHGAKGGRPAKNKGGSETPLPPAPNPPPSSSPSSATSPSGGGGEAPAVPPPTPAPPPEPPVPPLLPYDPATGKTSRPLRRCPADFDVTAGMVTWLAANCPLLARNTVLLDRENQRFRDTEFKTAKTDWRATWRSWMADKEGKLEERARLDQVHAARGQQQETAGHRQAREAAEVLTGGRASAKRPGSDGPPPGHPATLPFIDEEPRHVASRPATRLLR